MNTQVIAAFIGASVLLVMFAFVVIVVIVHQKKKEERHLFEKQELAITHQNTRMEEQEKLMNKISKEIHDNIGQIANLICTNILEIKTFTLKDDEQKIVANTHLLAERMMNDVRSISHSLNSDLIKVKGLVDSIKSELKLMEETKRWHTVLDVKGIPFSLSPKKELILFRIVQEALYNSLKHSKGSIIGVTVSYLYSYIKVEIADNGVGMRMARIGEADGIGFLNMFQRAKFLNGDLKVVSNNNGGVWILVAVPKPGYENQYRRPWI
jgi:two-component system, NarL family, sensor kinase